MPSQEVRKPLPYGGALLPFGITNIRTHKTLKTTPAVAAGLADAPHGFDFIVGLVEARAPKAGRPSKNT